MKDSISKFYEDLYGGSAKTKYVFGLPEKELVRFLGATNLKEIKVLDLGCGDGRNAIYLAKRNFNVTGIDNSNSALKKIKNLIKNSKITKNICFEKANLKTIKLEPDCFDFIICVYVFHEIGIQGTENLIRQAKLSTNPHGINYLAFGISKRGTFMRKECYYPRNEYVIIRQYKDWKIIKKKKNFLIHSHITPYSRGKKVKHKHYICHLFLQKPKMNLDPKTKEQIKKKALFYTRQARPAWNIPHLKAAVFYMNKLIKNEGGDICILLPAIYLHDIGYAGMLTGYYTHEDNQKVKKAHMEAGAKMSKKILDDIGNFSAKEIKKISYLVRIHDNLAKINDYESQLVFEADSLAQLDVGRVKPNFDKDDFSQFLDEFIKKRAPLFKTNTGLKILNNILPKAKSYYN